MEDNSPLNRYDSTLYFSIADEAQGDDVAADFLMEGDLQRVAAGLGCQMLRHPELIALFETALRCYDGLLEDAENS